MSKFTSDIKLNFLLLGLMIFTVSANAQNFDKIMQSAINYKLHTTNQSTYNNLTNDPVPIGRPGLMENCKYAYTSPKFLTPPDPVCEFDSSNFSAQVANGCPRGSGDNVGETFSKSVMAMYFPRQLDPMTQEPGFWSRSCTATVIDREWVITAAHCVASADPKTGHFYGEEASIPLYVVPWQNGSVPARLDASTIGIEKYAVEAVYIAYHYNYYGKPWPYPYPEHDYIKADFALLKLKNHLPSKYKVISLASNLPSPQTQIWFTGYGVIQGNNIDRGGFPYQSGDNNLNYRNMFYMSNQFPFDGAYKNSNLQEIYTLGTLPVNAGPQDKPSAWKFTGVGDSGGPFFYQNSSTNKLSLLGVLTGGTDCTWAGFMAPLPYPYTHGPSIPAYKELIERIIQNRASDSEVRHISPLKTAYLIVSDSGSIYSYNLDVLSGSLSAIKQKKPIGTYLSQITANQNFAFVADYLDKSIFTFKREDNAALSPLSGSKLTLPFNPTDINIFNNQYLFAVGSSASINKIVQFHISPTGYLTHDITLNTGDFPVSIAVARFKHTDIAENFVFVANASNSSARNYSISIYQFQNDKIKLLQEKYLLDRDGGEPLKIVADNNNHIFVLRSNGIYVYKFDISLGLLSELGHHTENYMLKSDMILLPNGSLVTSGLALNQYEIIFNDDQRPTFIKKTISTEAYIGLAEDHQFLDGALVLYAVNDARDTARTISEFISTKGSSFSFRHMYETGNNPTKILIK